MLLVELKGSMNHLLRHLSQKYDPSNKTNSYENSVLSTEKSAGMGNKIHTENGHG